MILYAIYAITGSGKKQMRRLTLDKLKLYSLKHELVVATLYEPGTVLSSFKKFRDPLQRTNLPKLGDWI